MNVCLASLLGVVIIFVNCYNSSVINLFNLKQLVLFPAKYITIILEAAALHPRQPCQDLQDRHHPQDRQHSHQQGRHQPLVHHLQKKTFLVFNGFITPPFWKEEFFVENVFFGETNHKESDRFARPPSTSLLYYSNIFLLQRLFHRFLKRRSPTV